jgi:hypothetical protein
MPDELPEIPYEEQVRRMDFLKSVMSQKDMEFMSDRVNQDENQLPGQKTYDTITSQGADTLDPGTAAQSWQR